MPGFSGQPSHNDTSNPDWAPFLDMTGCSLGPASSL